MSVFLAQFLSTQILVPFWASRAEKLSASWTKQMIGQMLGGIAGTNASWMKNFA